MRKRRPSEQTRQYCYQEEVGKQSVILRQIVALTDFVDVKAGSGGGWVDAESAPSQQGEYWIYGTNSVVFIGASIHDDARSIGPYVVGHEAAIDGRVYIHTSYISHHAQMNDNVTINHSLVRGYCRLTDGACLLPHCQMIAAHSLTAGRDKVLQIYQRATIDASRILHQAQAYSDTFVEHASVRHHAKVSDQARLEGNEENDVWVCGNARAYSHARLIAGHGEDAIPTVRYSSQVAENAVIEGNCLLKHRAIVGGEAQLRGGPIPFDDDVLIQGRTVTIDGVIVKHQASTNDEVQIAAQEGEATHLRSPKTLGGQQHITRTPLLGALQCLVTVNSARVDTLIVVAAVQILSLLEAAFKNEPIV